MSIQQTLNDQLKAAMRARDKRTLNLVRMLKSKMTETTTTKGFSGEVDDALWLSVITAYHKQQKKALEQYEAIGEAAAEHIDEIKFELGALEQFLPKQADEATTRQWVAEAVEGAGGKDSAKLGAVMGAVMKAHKGEVDASLVRQLVAEALA